MQRTLSPEALSVSRRHRGGAWESEPVLKILNGMTISTGPLAVVQLIGGPARCVQGAAAPDSRAKKKDTNLRFWAKGLCVPCSGCICSPA